MIEFNELEEMIKFLVKDYEIKYNRDKSILTLKFKLSDSHYTVKAINEEDFSIAVLYDSQSNVIAVEESVERFEIIIIKRLAIEIGFKELNKNIQRRSLINES